jgi:hypothetical protein
MNVFHIQFNETTYKVGSEVKGALKILKGGGLSLRDIELWVEGKESTTITKHENSTDPDSPTTQPRSVTYNEENKFLNLDLSSFIFEAQDQGGQFYEVPFHFNLSDAYPPTYKSKNVKISYELTALWKNRWTGGDKQTATFTVIPSTIMSEPSKLTAIGSNDKGIQITLNLDKQSFKKGEFITGTAKVLDPNNKIRSLSFILIGTEKVLAQGQSESIVNENESKLNAVEGQDATNINFRIPLEIPFSFQGSLVGYTYEGDLKADIAFSADVHAKVNLTIS